MDEYAGDGHTCRRTENIHINCTYFKQYLNADDKCLFFYILQSKCSVANHSSEAEFSSSMTISSVEGELIEVTKVLAVESIHSLLKW